MRTVDSEDRFSLGASGSKVKAPRVSLKALHSGDSTSSGVSMRIVFINDFCSFRDEDTALMSVF